MDIQMLRETRQSVLWIDRFMTHFIKIGGIGIILAVLGIFVFIFWQILPLFRPAAVRPLESAAVFIPNPVLLGSDEWGEVPFVLSADGRIAFVAAAQNKSAQTVSPFPAGSQFSAFTYAQNTQEIAAATADGKFSILTIRYEADFADNRRVIRPSASAGPFFEAGNEPGPIRRIAFSGNASEKIAALIQEAPGGPKAQAVVLAAESPMEEGLAVKSRQTLEISGVPDLMAVNAKAGVLLVSNTDGRVRYFEWTGEKFEARQTFSPFDDFTDPRIASMDFILGGNTAVFTGEKGESRIFSLFMRKGENDRRFGKIREFKDLPGPSAFFSHSQRNRAFLTGTRDLLSLRYATTGRIRWESRPGYSVRSAVLNGKYDRILALSEDGVIHAYALHDPHPDAGFQAFFGKVWYEGAPEPSYEWQSSSGSDEFEPKHSLVPLIIGTLKGTLYALIFALPIALLAALYTSQFAQPRLKAIVKPVMEIMASLPSVVLGFLAALWLAPLLENQVPSLILSIGLIVPAALLAGFLWSRLPLPIRGRLKPGYEFLLMLPIIFAVVQAGWFLGPVVEKAFMGGNFGHWWTQVTGLPFEQRNSLVVGFIMGFAVIPIIFTVSEDALSNVPSSLTSASLALGASRWQTAMRVVVPTASAGILSALMIGVGRAVGETMIVVMATGNTPILDFNIFSGMRTLSANIAVELPEAPVGGTLYRTLFLGAMVLFMMTFFVNTLAEVLRQRLREKYKLI